MKKWEYRVEALQRDTYFIWNEEKKEASYSPINELGEQGWELVNVVQTEDQKMPFGYFRREIKSDSYEVKSGAKLNLKTDIKINPDSYTIKRL